MKIPALLKFLPLGQLELSYLPRDTYFHLVQGEKNSIEESMWRFMFQSCVPEKWSKYPTLTFKAESSLNSWVLNDYGDLLDENVMWCGMIVSPDTIKTIISWDIIGWTYHRTNIMWYYKMNILWYHWMNVSCEIIERI